jgi:biotin carboxylase
VKRVLLLATTTGYQIRSFGEAADALGVRLMFASDRCDQLEDPWWDEAIPVRFHEERAAIEAVLARCGEAAPDAVVAVGDRPTVLAAHLHAAFGLPGNPPAAAAASRNKLAARAAFQAAGLPTPAFRAVSLEEDPAALARETRYPAVIKPLALSGSRGVMRVNDSSPPSRACAGCSSRRTCASSRTRRTSAR